MKLKSQKLWLRLWTWYRTRRRPSLHNCSVQVRRVMWLQQCHCPAPQINNDPLTMCVGNPKCLIRSLRLLEVNTELWSQLWLWTMKSNVRRLRSVQLSVTNSDSSLQTKVFDVQEKSVLTSWFLPSGTSPETWKHHLQEAERKQVFRQNTVISRTWIFARQENSSAHDAEFLIRLFTFPWFSFSFTFLLGEGHKLQLSLKRYEV